MKQRADTYRRPRKLFAMLLALAAVGLAAVVVAITTTGSSSTAGRSRQAADSHPGSRRPKQTDPLRERSK